MRRAPKIPLVSGTLYRNVAMLAVGLAVLVALFGSGDRGASDAAHLPSAGRPDRAAAVAPQELDAARSDEMVESADAVPPNAAEINPPAAAPEQIGPEQIGPERIGPEQIGPAPAASGPPPPLPNGMKLPAARNQIASPAKPTAAQIQHLIDQSRIRSGANPGGD